VKLLPILPSRISVWLNYHRLGYTLIMPRGDEDFEKYVRSRTVKPPAILYKFTTIETARIILSTGKLRFQSPLRYNDPFDTQWDPFWPAFTQKGKELEQAILMQAIRDPRSLPTDTRQSIESEGKRIELLPIGEREGEISRVAREIASRLPIALVVRQRFDELRRRLRVLCLCENVHSTLMWSHYADQHRGMVLGFDTAAIENGFKRPLAPVEYLKRPPELFDLESWIKSYVFGVHWNPDSERMAQQWLLAKHTDWQYEKEWRFALIAAAGTLGDYGDFEFQRAALVELVSGCRTDETRAVELRSLACAFRPDVRYSRMSTDPSRFQLDRIETPAVTRTPNKPLA
jgi:hypothetical protein